MYLGTRIAIAHEHNVRLVTVAFDECVRRFRQDSNHHFAFIC